MRESNSIINEYRVHLVTNIMTTDDLQQIINSIKNSHQDMIKKYGSMQLSNTTKDKILSDVLQEIDAESAKVNLLPRRLLQNAYELRGKLDSIYRLIPFIPYYNRSYLLGDRVPLYVDDKYMGKVNYINTDNSSIIGYEYEIVIDACKLRVQFRFR